MVSKYFLTTVAACLALLAGADGNCVFARGGGGGGGGHGGGGGGHGGYGGGYGHGGYGGGYGHGGYGYGGGYGRGYGYGGYGYGLGGYGYGLGGYGLGYGGFYGGGLFYGDYNLGGGYPGYYAPNVYPYPAPTYSYSGPAASYAAPGIASYPPIAAGSFSPNAYSSNSYYYPPMPTDAGSPATVHVTLPSPEATVVFDGHVTTSKGKDRYYQTPELKSAGSYQLRVSWMQDGKQMTEEKTVAVTPGQTADVVFTGRASEPAAAASAAK
jgi:uncharacterized protein (TIGR03000 family)